MLKDHSSPLLSSASDWLGQIYKPIKSTTQIWVVRVISMEFLRSFLRRRFAENQWWRCKMSAVFSGYIPETDLTYQFWASGEIGGDESKVE